MRLAYYLVSFEDYNPPASLFVLLAAYGSTKIRFFKTAIFGWEFVE
jgi:hypothetical protein